MVKLSGWAYNLTVLNSVWEIYISGHFSGPFSSKICNSWWKMVDNSSI